jgi:uncharacterized protein (DUF433 family)
MNDLARVERMFYIGPEMLRNKPTRAKGQDIRTVPTYTIPEAAAFLAINTRTLFSWYEGQVPVLEASAKVGSFHLLSYRDLEEAYRVYLLRERHEFSLQFLRRSMQNARRMFRSKHPLQRADAVQECLKDLVYNKPARGENPRTITSLGHKPGQQIVREVADLYAERIVDGEFIYPWRFAATDRVSKPVSMNPRIMSGRLVVAGTRIPVNAIWGQKRAGVSVEEIAKDYRLSTELVEKALLHFGIRQEAA